jgi:hypothetical protein
LRCVFCNASEGRPWVWQVLHKKKAPLRGAF